MSLLVKPAVGSVIVLSAAAAVFPIIRGPGSSLFL